MAKENEFIIKGKVSVKTVTCLAITQLVLGSLTSTSGFALFLYGNRKEFIIYGGYGLCGIFGGVWYIVTGILGLASSRRPTNFIWNNTHMAFSMSAIFVVLFSVLGTVKCITNLNGCFVTYYEGLPGEFYCEKKRTATAFAWLMLIFNILELFVAFVACIFTCLFYGGCCHCCIECCFATDKNNYNHNGENTYRMSYQNNQINNKASAPPENLPYNPNVVQAVVPQSTISSNPNMIVQEGIPHLQITSPELPQQ